jgi:hypothetical protein
VINNTTNVSFNGGAGGTAARATPQELAAANERHTPMTAMQTQHQSAASTNPAMHASNNNGHPQVAATSHAGQFTGAGVVGARTATGPAGGNPAAGGAAEGATGAPGAGPGQKVTNATPSLGGPATGPGSGGGAGPGKLPGSGGAGPGKLPGPGGAGPAKFTGGGPAGPKTANFAAPRPVIRPGGGPRPGGGGGPHPAKGPPPHH